MTHVTLALLFEHVYSLFPKEKIEIKPTEQKLVIIEAPFVEEISGFLDM